MRSPLRSSRLKRFALLTGLSLAKVWGQSVWNPTTDFTLANGNPNGVWTYGWMDTAFTTFTPYSANLTNSGAGGSPQWYAPIGGDLTPAIWQNLSASTSYGVAPGQLSFHPGPAAQPTVLRWTTPGGVTGLISLSGQFFSGDSGVMQVAVREGSSVLWNATDSGTFNFSVNVVPGDMLDFAVYGGYAFGNTPFELTITSPIPETGSWAAAVGVVMLGFAVWRRKIHRAWPA